MLFGGAGQLISHDDNDVAFGDFFGLSGSDLRGYRAAHEPQSQGHEIHIRNGIDKNPS
jgi:hypothetical protein